MVMRYLNDCRLHQAHSSLTNPHVHGRWFVSASFTFLMGHALPMDEDVRIVLGREMTGDPVFGWIRPDMTALFLSLSLSV